MSTAPRVLVLLAVMIFFSCDEDGLIDDDNTFSFPQTLTELSIFTGELSLLQPEVGFEPYELSTELYSDYASKQRLIKLPPGTKMKIVDDGLVDFPDNTVMVKTFYYNIDEADPGKGKKIIETRILLKLSNNWNVATYRWNDQQDQGHLLTMGADETVNHLDVNGEPQVRSYHIPSTRECATCHNSDGLVIPIGPKAANLNVEVNRSGVTENQLTHFMNSGILQPVNVSSVGKVPQWDDDAISVSERGRAYLDVNCAHCHNPAGRAAESRLYLDYYRSYDATHISRHKTSIIQTMKKGRMPMLGISAVHNEGLDLIKSYIESL